MCMGIVALEILVCTMYILSKLYNQVPSLTPSIWQTQLWFPQLNWKVWKKNNILGLKMIMKSGLENYFEIPPCASHFLLNGFTSFDQKYKFSNKMTWWAHGGISKLFFLDPYSSSFFGQHYYFLSYIPFWSEKPKLNLSYIGC